VTARIAITTGEPAGIGPDLCLLLNASEFDAELVLIGDAGLLTRRAALLGLPVSAAPYDPASPAHAGRLCIAEVTLPVQAEPGQLNPANASYVLATLDRAMEGCRRGEFAAMVTAPVHKGVINDAGTGFTGHTEYLA